MLIYSHQDILSFEKYFRISLLNKISGLKSANLIATKSKNDKSNVAIFNSVIHIGANPPYLGFIMRPTTVDRHTYDNIKNIGLFTINQVTASIHQNAHLSAAKFPKDISEFDTCQLSEVYIDDFPIPFVKESPIKIALSYQEEHEIAVNNTRLIIGKVEKLILPDDLIKKDGDIDFEIINGITIGGLDTYYTVKRLGRYAYAKPNQAIKKIV